MLRQGIDSSVRFGASTATEEGGTLLSWVRDCREVTASLREEMDKLTTHLFPIIEYSGAEKLHSAKDPEQPVPTSNPMQGLLAQLFHDLNQTRTHVQFLRDNLKIGVMP